VRVGRARAPRGGGVYLRVARALPSSCGSVNGFFVDCGVTAFFHDDLAICDDLAIGDDLAIALAIAPPLARSSVAQVDNELIVLGTSAAGESHFAHLFLVAPPHLDARQHVSNNSNVRFVIAKKAPQVDSCVPPACDAPSAAHDAASLLSCSCGSHALPCCRCAARWCSLPEHAPSVHPSRRAHAAFCLNCGRASCHHDTRAPPRLFSLPTDPPSSCKPITTRSRAAHGTVLFLTALSRHPPRQRRCGLLGKSTAAEPSPTYRPCRLHQGPRRGGGASCRRVSRPAEMGKTFCAHAFFPSPEPLSHTLSPRCLLCVAPCFSPRLSHIVGTLALGLICTLAPCLLAISNLRSLPAPLAPTLWVAAA
jgi:hypothetical protein